MARGLRRAAVDRPNGVNVSPSSPRLDDFAHPLAASGATARVVGGITVAMGAFCALAAFTAPVLFGPLVALVIATERILRATQSRDRGLAAAWLMLALAWFGLAACMLHTPLLGNASLQSSAALLLALSAACWTRSRIASSPTWRYEVAPVLAGTAGALLLLYSGPPSMLSRVAAAASISLALVGCEWIAATAARSMMGAGTPRRAGAVSSPSLRWTGALEPRGL